MESDKYSVPVTVDLNDCWLWAGRISEYGYGVIYFRENGKSFNLRAHRIVYENLIGPIPKGLVIDHLCRVRHCINPDHLEPVTNKENVLRGIGISAKNKLKTSCINGHVFDEKSLYIHPSGARNCRTCRNIRQNLKWRLNHPNSKIRETNR